MSLTTACGASPSAAPASTTGTDPAAAAGTTPPEEGGGDPARDGEFQMQNSETAGQAHGERPSEIEATATHAAMRLFVVNADSGPIPGIVIKMTAPDGTAYFTGETDSLGYGEVLVPVGQRYEMVYLALGRQNTSANVDVPTGPNQDIRLTMRYRRWRPTPVAALPEQAEEEPQGLVLEGILFNTGHATIQEQSFPRLDRVVEYLTHRLSAGIRISGHTDNVGNPRGNQRLSEARAEAVRAYLISHGIDAGRVEAVGYGDQRPVASNDTEDGRRRNRRIEAVEI
ncbi:MAG: OmpA family protein [Deltaproteobacteria bacterium]|nr:OmpA family protein [Deltaproteobacteria bacterium]